MKNKRIVLLLTVFASFGMTAHAAQMTLSWTDNSTNETGFIVERADGLTPTAGDFKVIATPPVNATSHVDAALQANTGYSYRVAAYNTAGKSGYSNIASGTTKDSAPTAPSASGVTAPADYTPPVPTITMLPGNSLNIVAAGP